MAIHDAFYTDEFQPVHAFYRGEQTAEQVAFLEKAIPLRPGADVLDLACGFGRHSLVLAERGYRVTGCDASADFIARARQAAAEAGLTVAFNVADQRRLDAREAFDAVLSLGTSLTFYDDATSKDIMRRVYAALRSGGTFVYDQANIFQMAAMATRNHGPTTSQLSDGRKHTTSLSFNAATCVLSRRSVMEGPNGRTQAGWDMRYFAMPELLSVLTGLDFHVHRVFGEYDGSPYTVASPRIIVLADK